jgi:hypothetical protein
MTTLPANADRCAGMWVVDSLGGEWREGCEDCLRRTTPPPESGATWMEPPLIVAFWCEGLIQPEGKQS